MTRQVKKETGNNKQLLCQWKIDLNLKNSLVFLAEHETRTILDEARFLVKERMRQLGILNEFQKKEGSLSK